MFSRRSFFGRIVTIIGAVGGCLKLGNTHYLNYDVPNDAYARYIRGQMNGKLYALYNGRITMYELAPDLDTMIAFTNDHARHT